MGKILKGTLCLSILWIVLIVWGAISTSRVTTLRKYDTPVIQLSDKVYSKPTTKGHLHSNDMHHDLQRLYPELFENIPEYFNKEFKNPCWYEESTLRCLPYFYLIGISKCGTTDIWYKLINHPQVQGVPKEPHWWSKRRNGWTDTPVHSVQVKRVRHLTGLKDDSSLKWYLNWYKIFAVSEVKKHHNTVFGDGSVTTSFTSLHNWARDFPHSAEPPYSLADLMHTLQPTAKIIVTVREPVSRYYSAHLYNGGHSAWSLKKIVPNSVECMKTCLQNHPERFCAYKGSCDQVFRGMYSVFVTDWIKAYGHGQVHVIRLDDWINNPVEEYKDLITFLELDMISEEGIASIVHKQVKNTQRKKRAKAGEIFNSTKLLLQEFYRPFNHKLADLLNDTRFLWDYA